MRNDLVRDYDIMMNENGKKIAVPFGFNWNALLFGPFWAGKYSNRMSFLMFLWLIVSQGVTCAIAKRFDSDLAFVMAFVPYIASFLVFGFYGNRWRVHFLEKESFKKVDEIAAEDEEAALIAYDSKNKTKSSNHFLEGIR